MTVRNFLWISIILFYHVTASFSLHIMDQIRETRNGDNENDTTAESTTIALMIPFRDRRCHLDFNGNEYQESIISDNDNLREGVSLLIAAALAIDDFNRRQSSLMDGLDKYKSCSLHFSDIELIDTQRLASQVIQHKSLWYDASAIAGIQDNQVAQAIADTMIDNSIIPTISHGAFVGPTTTTTTTSNESASNVYLGSASWTDRMKALVGYLETIRVPNAALLYAPGEETQLYFSGLQEAAKDSAVTVYDTPSPRDKSHLKETLQKICDDEIQIVIVAWERDDHIEVLADVAHSLGMNHVFWIFMDSYLPPNYVDKLNPPMTSPLGRLLLNARIFQVLDATISPGRRRFVDDHADETTQKYTQALQTQGVLFLDRTVQALMGEMTRSTSYGGTTAQSLLDQRPTYGTGFLYDSIIAMGMAACNGLELHRPSFDENEDHNHGDDNEGAESHDEGSISSQDGEDEDQRRRRRRRLSSSFPEEVDFEGVTGRFRIQSNGARDPEGLQFGMFFIRKYYMDDSYWTSLHDRTVNGEWVITERVDDLYIPRYARVFGFLLSGTAILFCLGLAVALYRLRDCTKIRMGQPAFLFAVCFGAILIALSIVFMSFDDSSIDNVQTLDRLCLAEVWMADCGKIIVYMALFSKLLRIKKVAVGRKNQKVLPHHVIMPFLLLVVCTLGILITWTLEDPPKFIRKEIGSSVVDGTDEKGLSIDPITMPVCTFHKKYQIALQGLFLLCIFLVCFMAYRVRALPEEITDAKRVSKVLYAHLAITIVGGAMYATGIYFSSWATVYFARCIVSFAYATTSVGFLIFSKVVHGKNAARDGDCSEAVSRGTVHISGLDWEPSSSEFDDSKLSFKTEQER